VAPEVPTRGDSPGRPETFLFADLAGFTALTEAHGDRRAAGVAEQFCHRVRAGAARVGAEVVKTIGDAVLIHDRRADRAIELGMEILEEEEGLEDSPEVRIGIHTGSAVRSGGDWYGAAVNVAARVVAVAAAGEVVLTDAAAVAAGRLEHVELERLGTRELRNVGEPVLLLRASRPGPHRGAAIVDPVCRMTVAEGEWIGILSYGGRTFHFCSMECARRFSNDPERYAGVSG
jgi:class 3 adenylate cyclase/YHS domain-containing protein